MRKSSPNSAPRSRVLFYAITICLLGGSLAAGFYLPNDITKLIGLADRGSNNDPPACCCANKDAASDLPACCAAKLAAAKEAAPAITEFALSSADRKEQLEAPTLAVDSLGRVFVAWASQTAEKERTLFMASSLTSGKSFDPPKPVQQSEIFSFQAEMKGRTVTRAIRMVPHLAAAGDNLVLAWLASANNNTVKMMLAESTDGGLSFGPARCVHQNDSARPTFTSLSADKHGRVLASWLDHRAETQHPFMTFRSNPTDPLREEQQIPAGEEEKGVCPCCPTASVIGPDGAFYVAFRNLVGGYRDIYVAKFTDTGLVTVTPVVEPTWQFDGCPHDGPSLAIVGSTLHIVWMDGRSGTQRVYYGQASTSDLKFTTKPLNESGPGTQGNAKLAAVENGIIAVWEESTSAADGGDEAKSTTNAAEENQTRHSHGPTGSARGVMFAFAPTGGDFGPAAPVLPREGRFQTRPAVVGVSDGKFVVAFNELDEQGKRIVIVRQPVQPPMTELPVVQPAGELTIPADE